MSSLIERKSKELQSKLLALPQELQTWIELSENGMPYEKHSSQIRKLSAQIRGLYSVVEEEVEKANSSSQIILEQCRRLETKMLAVHSVWDYFRSKFMMRTQEPFADFLKAADAFAWACYKPSQEHYGKDKKGDLREPPLVALQNDWSPSALPRDHKYHVLRTPGGWTETAPFTAVIEALPVPILGLPWSYLEHLPHLALLAHEVGHVVEQDFELGTQLDAMFRHLGLDDASHREAWQSWQQELFADWYGCVAAGPAFGWALIDVLGIGMGVLLLVPRSDGHSLTYSQ